MCKMWFACKTCTWTFQTQFEVHSHNQTYHRGRTAISRVYRIGTTSQLRKYLNYSPTEVPDVHETPTLQATLRILRRINRINWEQEGILRWCILAITLFCHQSHCDPVSDYCAQIRIGFVDWNPTQSKKYLDLNEQNYWVVISSGREHFNLLCVRFADEYIQRAWDTLYHHNFWPSSSCPTICVNQIQIDFREDSTSGDSWLNTPYWKIIT